MLSFFTQSPTIFVSSPNVYEKLLHFPAETQFFNECSSVHVKCTFDDCAENFELNMEEVHTEIPKVMRKFEIVGKISKWSSRMRKRSLFNSEQTRLFLVKVFSTLSFKNIWKNLVLSRSCFSSKWSSVRVNCSSDKLTELLHQKSDPFFYKVQRLWKEMLHLSAEIQFFIKCSPVHVKCLFDNSSWNFQLNMETIHTKIPKKMREHKNVGKKSQNWAPELGNSVLSTVNKQGCAWSKHFSLSVPKKYEKLSPIEKLFFFKMIFRTGQMQLWQTCRTRPPKSDIFSVKSKGYEKKCYTFPRKSNLSSNDHLYT